MHKRISVINKSSVTAKFQTRVAVLDEDGIFDAINVTAWGETMSGEHVGSWMQFAPSENAETPIMEVPVTVSLPNSDTYTIGVQGKNLSIVFSVIAVQGNAYTGPTANITKYTQEQLPVRNPITGNLGGITFPEAPEEITVESAWSFATLDTEETVQTSQYKDWVCDFIIECDKEVALGELGLWGTYGGMDFAFANPYALSEGQSLFMMTSVGMPVTYEYICSEVKVFDCGVFRGLVAPQMKGKKITVSLCLINPDYAMELINEVANEFPEYNETEILFEVMKKSRWEKAIGKDVLIANKTEYIFE